MAIRFLQANINHSARAQDLLLQSLAEWSTQIAVVAEPYLVPSRDNWVADREESVAIITQSSASSLPFEKVAKGQGCVMAVLGGGCGVAVIGVYCSPNRPLVDFERILAEVGVLAGTVRSSKILVAGDFNAKSTAWGSPTTDARGSVLEEWAVSLGLMILNRGTENTCVRQQGGSIVDLTFASPTVARRVRDWCVETDVETLSDHRYIRFSVSASAGQDVPSLPVNAGPRWSLRGLNREVAVEAAIVEAWMAGPVTEDVDDAAVQLGEALARVCDASMPRVKTTSPPRTMYWWKPELRQLRSACVATRRLYTRCRRRRVRDEEQESERYANYRAACKDLQVAIKEAKESAWREWLESLDRDPWGRPYKSVTGKLRPWAPPLTTTLEPQLLERVVAALFPQREAWCPPAMPSREVLPDETDARVPPVSETELGVAVLRLRSKNAAPGPDGVPGRVLVHAAKELGAELRALFSACLTQGHFPQCWKRGKLVLLKKNGRPADSPSAYRPIVLLGETSKLFERVLAARLVQHLVDVGPNLSDGQFGFRHGRSTVDAIARVRELAEEAISGGGVLLAVSLDIKNAFNTLPWETVLEALRYHGVPRYLRDSVVSYFADRAVIYPAQGGEWKERRMSCGVPQGSVLGPLLWNIGYDYVLRGQNLHGIGVVCYADDTLVTARGSTYREAAILATAGVAQVVRRIRMLGLEVALEKSEALVFHGPRKAPPIGQAVVVGGTSIAVESTMRYLGLVLDGRWRFEEHFQRLAPKLIAFAGVLGSLLPNVGGPSVLCRRLFAGVVRSKALYGAPIWANALNARNQTLLRRPQRVIAIRAARAYHTVSFEAACLLASTPPWDLEAGVLAAVYRRSADVKKNGGWPMPEEIKHWREQGREDLFRHWSERMESPAASRDVVAAFRPVLQEWVDRRHGAPTFRLAQILSGHGCFGRYLCRVARREPTMVCHHCGALEDTAQHTRAECPAWAVPRAELISVIGGDLSLSAIVRAMTESESKWRAVACFAEQVLREKETAERDREDDILSDPIRRRRTGRRRLAFANRMQP